MKNKVIIVAILLANILSVKAQTNSNNKLKPFYISGEIDGVTSGVVYIDYSREKGHVLDTSLIKNGKFFFKGECDEPLHAYLDLNSQSYAEIFIEPGNMKITAQKDSFRFLKMTGSLSQSD